MNPLWTLEVEAPNHTAARLAMLEALDAPVSVSQVPASSEDGVDVRNVAEGLLASNILDAAGNPIRFLLATCQAITESGLRVKGWPAPRFPHQGDPDRNFIRFVLTIAWEVYQGVPSIVTDEQLDAFLAHVMPPPPA